MQTSLNPDYFEKVQFLTGSAAKAADLPNTPALIPFNDTVMDFLNEVSKNLMKNPEARPYSDVITFGFWIRKASTIKLKERFEQTDGDCRLGRGVAFHIAPSNVPVNFAYSLVAGLLCGNANVVRIPTKDFPQVSIIVNAINRTLDLFESMRPYLFLVRYERDKEINDYFSSIADVRIVWGGDNTIAELRKSSLPARSIEVTFADRYSLAVIDSDKYMAIEDKARVAQDFYNDTFFSDQNACTSPRIVIWTGTQIEKAKTIFWKYEHELVENKYLFQSIQGVNKLTSSYLVSVAVPGCKVESHEDNLIIRVKVPYLSDSLMNYKDNSGFFFEYDCTNTTELKNICNNKRCQTLAYIGDSKTFFPLLESGIKGIDRIVPVGKTMDFDLIWDGYDLFSFFSRTVITT